MKLRVKSLLCQTILMLNIVNIASGMPVKAEIIHSERFSKFMQNALFQTYKGPVSRVRLLNVSVNGEGKILNDSTGKVVGQVLPGVKNVLREAGAENTSLEVKVTKAGYISEIPSGLLIGTVLGAEE
ncbi:MAG: hypothetical protein K2W82_09740 [Candidatus Obscuribacterales bacterium]|nr:hypothetical protein [Candidatus Obscuribacterales bacterium]